MPANAPVQLDLWSDYAKDDRRIAIERTVDEIRRRFGLKAINFASLTTGLKIPTHREIEYKMPSVMYH